MWSLTRVIPTDIGPLGIAPLLPLPYLGALAVAVAGVAVSLGRARAVKALLAFQLVVLVVVLHGIDPIVHGTPRLEASYRHLGIIAYIAERGSLDPQLDAYFSWPGFFALLAMLSGAAGAGTLFALATWAPLGVNLLLMPVLLTLAGRLAPGWRTAWAAVSIYYLVVWVGQDYLAPQALAFLLALSLLAIVLTCFGGHHAAHGTHEAGPPVKRLLDRLEPHALQPLVPPAPARVALLVIATLLLLAITAGHQLTPYALALTLLALVATGQTRLSSLPTLAVLLPIGWLVLVATPYLLGHHEQLFGSLGDVTGTAEASVGNRVAGDPRHQIVVALRLAQTASVWCTGALGAFLLRRRGAPWLATAACAGAPLLMAAMQPYGGEMVMRAYLYGLPFAAVLVAACLVPARQHTWRWQRTAAVTAVGLALAATTLFTRYGNSAMESFTPKELALVQRLYQVAPSGSLVIEAVHNTPWRYRDYAGYDYVTIATTDARPELPDLTCRHVENLAAGRGGYLLVTRSQVQAANLLGVGAPGGVGDFVDACRDRPGWETIADHNGGTLLYVAPNAERRDAPGR